jgi:hypothetical protein
MNSRWSYLGKLRSPLCVIGLTTTATLNTLFAPVEDLMKLQTISVPLFAAAAVASG